ncbi:MAG: class I SAM-dependent methyltransferase [Anaerolineales bacterium]|nr:class I SAM-dependent methyltransferase [Anaerolineales bacterium]
MNQDDIFFHSEGNRWFLRNRSALIAEQRLVHDPVLKILELADLKPENVLEIGASNGYRLHELQTRLNCRATAIEPSQEAIEDGQARYPEITFLQGIASALPINDNEQFDLVIVNFVFHWIDRATLLRSVAETDRVLKDGGHLIIGDFYPAYPERVTYHHLPESNVWTYKQNYTEIFLATHLYDLMAFLALDHSSHQVQPVLDSRNRIQVAVLRKTLDGGYQTTALNR